MNDVPAAPTPPSQALLPALGRLGRLIRKELSEILRDRRTIFTLVLMPVLLYPLLSMAFKQFFLASIATEPVTTYKIGVGRDQEAQFINYYLGLGHHRAVDQAVATLGLSGPGGVGPVAAGGLLLTFQPILNVPRRVFTEDKPPPRLIFLEAGHLENAVRDRQVHLGIRMKNVPGPPDNHRDFAATAQLIYLENDPHSVAALRHVERHLSQSNAFFLQERLWALGVRQRATPLRLFATPVDDAEPVEGLSLAALIPLILILMTITGAVYPAIDLTAGERERGTLEILVAAPVPRLALLFAKYVSVVTVALLTAVINLVMMLLTLQVSGLSRLLFGDSGLSAEAIVPMFGLLVLFALFFSALLLALASFARSFKEAQAYLIPLMLVSLAPGVAALLPGLKLAGMLTVVPLLNIVLLSRDLLQGTAEPMVAAVVVFSTLLYAAAAIAAAARVFGAEAVLYSEQSAWADLFRRPRQPLDTAPVSTALLCLALMFPLTFVLHNLIPQLTLGVADPQQFLGLQIGLVVLVSLLLFGLLPLAAAGLGRIRLTTGFQLRWPPWPALLGGLLLGVALWPFAIEFLAWMRLWGVTTPGPANSDLIVQKMRQLREAYPATLVVAAFALPALAEEWYFRGFLFAALRSSTGPGTTIGVSALLFGLFHLIVTDAFALERLLPSTALGVVLGWVAYRSGSVLPGMLLHACHNGLLVAVSYSDLAGQNHLPLPLLLGAAGVALVGWVLTLWCKVSAGSAR